MIDSEKRILIIDPDENDRNVMATFLRQHNYSVETAKGLSDALKKVSEGCYDCLIMDVDLPEMKGFDAVSIFRNIDPKIKVIMTAKKNSMELESKVREQDIYYYFIKSFGKDELRLAINNAFNQ
ncbi:MAG: response regulator [Candidatus Aminicenantaceae bacterium]|nr:response regulator [Candidatus Heimdallarchaeota archaeon]